MIPVQPYGPTITINGNGYLLADTDLDGNPVANQSTADRVMSLQQAVKYQNDVWEVLRDIEKGNGSRVGKLLMNAIDKCGASGKTCTIAPWRQTRGFNALTFFSNRLNVFDKNQTLETVWGLQQSRSGGTNAAINYEPTMFGCSCGDSVGTPEQHRLEIDPGHMYQPDSVLFHELCHALRFMTGKMLGGVVDNLFPNPEEFFAVLVTNIYMSELGVTTPALRGSYPAKSARYVRMDEVIPGLASHPYAWRRRYTGEITGLCNQMPDFTRAIADLQGIDWNPLRYHYYVEDVGNGTGLGGALELSGNGNAN